MYTRHPTLSYLLGVPPSPLQVTAGCQAIRLALSFKSMPRSFLAEATEPLKLLLLPSAIEAAMDDCLSTTTLYHDPVAPSLCKGLELWTDGSVKDHLAGCGWKWQSRGPEVRQGSRGTCAQPFSS
eukprot:5265741-Amphidinium_carterae.1